MADNFQYTSGTPGMYKDDRGGGALIPHPVIGVVKDNIDEKHAGRIRVFLTDYGGGDPNDEKSWITVNYLSPWFGSTMGSSAPNEYGKFTSNPQSYGFWATAPDIGTKVICIFINGKPNQGYYIGGLPSIGQHFMVPAIASAQNVVPSESEATTYGGAPRVPVTEANNLNPENKNSSRQADNPKPIHSFQASILSNQGLIRDPVRGVISSSSMRETPSSVFGMSTPGAPIWEGGYTRQNIQSALKGADPSKLKVIGRTGGHSLVMDDGELFTGQNQLVRLRSAAGHQITLSDDGQVLFITHSNGNSWVELGPQGTIDMYSKNSFNVRTQGDINLHADLNINVHAGKDFNVNAENINMQSRMNTTVRVAGNSTIQTLGTHTHKVGAALSMSAGGDASLVGATTFITGQPVNLNTGSSGTQPADVPAATPIEHVETQFSSKVGWMNPAQSNTLSITSRLPTHQPWALAGKGIDDSEIPDNVASTPSASDNVLSTTNNAVASAPQINMVTPELAKTVPVVNAQIPGAPLDTQTKQAIISQNAINIAKMTVAEKQRAGIIPGIAGLSLKQLEDSGILKAGVALAAGALMARGVPFEQAVSNNSFTGSMGVTSAESLISNSSVQAQIASLSIDNAGLKLIDLNVIPQNPSSTEVAGLINAVNLTSAGEVVEQLVLNASNPTPSTTISTNQTATGTAPSSPSTSSNGSSSNSVLAAISAGAVAAGIASNFLKGGGGLPTSLSDLKNKISTGLTTLSNSITGAANDIKNKIGGAFASLKAAGQKAFAAAEESFANLKAGVPNSLAGGTPSDVSPTQRAANEYDIAKEEREIALEDLLDAKRKYADEKTSTNLALVQEAEQRVAAADKKIYAASQAFLSAAGGGVGGGVSAGLNSAKGLLASLGGNQGGFSIDSAAAAINEVNAVSDMVASPSNSGINALPGGLGAFVAQTGSGSSTAIKDTFGNLTSSSTVAGLPSVPTSTDAKNLLGSLKGAGSTLGVSVQTDVSSISAGGGASSPPTIAGPSGKGAAFTAKIGQLLGDARIPLPPTKPVEPSPEMSMEEVDAELTAKEKALQDLRNAELNLRLVRISPVGSVASAVQDAEQKVDAARKAYQNIVNSEA